MTNTEPYSLLTGTLTQEDLTRQNADAARVQELLLAENSALRAVQTFSVPLSRSSSFLHPLLFQKSRTETTLLHLPRVTGVLLAGAQDP